MGDDALDLDFVVLDVDDEELVSKASFGDVAPVQASRSPVDMCMQADTSSISHQVVCGSLDPSATVRCREFEVTIDMGGSKSIGLDVDKTDGKSILVIFVKEGPVADYNATSQEDKVKKGDRIVALNGSALEDLPDVSEVLAQSQRVVLKIRRMEEFCMIIEKTSWDEKLGIDVDHACGETLKVISVGKPSPGDHVVPTSQELVKRLQEAGLQSGTGIVREVHRAVDPMKGSAVDVRFNDTNHVVEQIPMAWLQKTECSRGPVERYNAQVAPELCLQHNDTITEVNGLSGAGGKVKGLLAYIAMNQKLALLVKRGEEGALEAAQSAPPLQPLT